jgi:transposase
MTNPYQLLVGIDLGSQWHQVCVVDREGKLVGERKIDHDGQGIQQLLTWLAELAAAAGASPETIAIGLEAPRGALVDALIERGYCLFSINPKQLDRFRDRYSVAGAKDDSRDAFVLGTSLRTDLSYFRRLHPDQVQIVRLREMSRAYHALQEDYRRNSNQLWSYLQRYFPSLLKLSSSADELWIFDLLEQCQAQTQLAAAVPIEELAQLLRRRRIRRFSAETLCQCLQDRLPLAAGVEQALAEQVLLLLPRLRLLYQQRSEVEQRTDRLLEEMTQPEFSEHRSVEILRSIPGLGRVFLATVLSEAFRPLLDRDYHGLRLLAGVAPVTRRSGKTTIISMRRACDDRLRHAVQNSANTHMQKDPRAKQIYSRLRGKAATHARALRGVGDRLLELICVLLRSDQLYQIERRNLKTDAA